MRAGFDSLLTLVIFLVFTGFAVAALVFAAMAREDAYRAAEKQTKKFWLILLAVNLVINLLLPMLFLQIAGLIAAIVFMVDVRPALAQVSGGGGRRGGGSSSDGPYGPYNGGR
ncbi:membrane protein [Streptomyces narbonensis]|nr:membrane protein [Streptomyces narbonensis]